MGIVTHETVRDEVVDAEGRRRLTYKYVFHTGLEKYVQTGIVPAAFDGDADRTARIPQLELGAAWEEIEEQADATQDELNPDKVPADYQTQADFDRRLLATMMQVRDAHHFLASLPFFQAVESRGGANANARATYLGVIRAEYDLVADRYGNVQGAAFFLNDEKNQIWDDVPSEDWQ